MTFINLLDKSADLYRLQATGDKEKWSKIATINVHLQPLADEMLEKGGTGAFYQRYKAWSQRDTMIYEGDRLVINSETYTVAGVEDFNIGNFPHLEIYLEKGNV